VQAVTGHITVVQEQRFRVVSEAGQGFLFTLAKDAGLDGSDLRRLHDERQQVVVEYTGEPGLASGVARSVKAAPSPACLKSRTPAAP
jgi:hypothetical protein